MKRVSYTIALDSILSMMDGRQKIRIYDRQNAWDDHPALIYEGTGNEFRSIKCVLPKGYSEYKVERSQVHRMDIEEDGVLCFTIQTKYEEY